VKNKKAHCLLMMRFVPQYLFCIKFPTNYHLISTKPYIPDKQADETQPFSKIVVNDYDAKYGITHESPHNQPRHLSP
jgi:hypothetical protein